jgi:dTDP-4-amino-4,6-dideoxygalactose transaminase
VIAIGPIKRRPADLAILGGPPTFVAPLHVGRPNLGDRERLFERIAGALDRSRLTNDGPLVREFEGRVREISEVGHAIAVANATLGLQVLVRAMALSGEVIVPAFTFVGTAHAMTWMGVDPVFCDIRSDSPTIDPDMVDRLIGPRTSAILGVHVWGRICDVERLAAISAKHSIPVIYDAAHAFSCRHAGTPVGSFGAAEVFSFHATKFVNAFEGGMVVTNDDRLANDLSRIRNFGFHGSDRTEMLGTNAKMHEASAAMGLTSLEAMEGIVRINRRNRDHYRSGLARIDGVRLLDDADGGTAQYIVVRIASGARLHRDEIQRVLVAENVLARRYFYPGCHRMAPYIDRSDLVREPLVNTEVLADEVLVLPTGTTVGPDEIEAVCNLIRFSLENAAHVRTHAGAS